MNAMAQEFERKVNAMSDKEFDALLAEVKGIGENGPDAKDYISFLEETAREGATHCRHGRK